MVAYNPANVFEEARLQIIFDVRLTIFGAKNDVAMKRCERLRHNIPRLSTCSYGRPDGAQVFMSSLTSGLRRWLLTVAALRLGLRQLSLMSIDTCRPAHRRLQERFAARSLFRVRAETHDAAYAEC